MSVSLICKRDWYSYRLSSVTGNLRQHRYGLTMSTNERLCAVMRVAWTIVGRGQRLSVYCPEANQK